MTPANEMELKFDSRSANEGFARVAVAAFMTQLNPTVEEVADVKTAVSEAVTNVIIHGYEKEVRKVYIKCMIEENIFTVEYRGGNVSDVYDQTGSGSVRYGICVYGGVYGQRGSRV